MDPKPGISIKTPEGSLKEFARLRNEYKNDINAMWTKFHADFFGKIAAEIFLLEQKKHPILSDPELGRRMMEFKSFANEIIKRPGPNPVITSEEVQKADDLLDDIIKKLH